MKKQYRSFESAREFARKLNLKSQKEWNDYCKSGKKPDDIPSTPRGTYKNEYKGDGDWLGTGTVAPKDRVFLSFKEARDFVRALNLKSLKEWQDYSKSGNKPNDISSYPSGTYKKDWKGFGDWLGTRNVATRDRVYRPFKEAREFVRSLGLKGQKEWKEYCASGNKPDDIPSAPWSTYKEWKKK